MSGLTRPIQETFLNWMRGRMWYVGLFTRNPFTDTGTLNGSREVEGGSYARVPIPAGVGWTEVEYADGISRIHNAVDIKFAKPTSAWGVVMGIGLFDTEMGGNLIMWEPIHHPHMIYLGVIEVKFPAGDLSLSLD